MSFHQDEFHQKGSQEKLDVIYTTFNLIQSLKDDLKYEAPLTNKHGQVFDLKYTLERVEYIMKLVRKI